MEYAAAAAVMTALINRAFAEGSDEDFCHNGPEMR
jgi:hypothetical protein